MSKLTKKDIIRAWKDPEFRQQLSTEQLAQLPENPAGSVELSSAELSKIDGGRRRSSVTSIPCELDSLTYTENTWPCCGTKPFGTSVGGKLSVSRQVARLKAKKFRT